LHIYKAKIQNSARNGKQIEAEGGSNKCLWKVCLSPHYSINLSFKYLLHTSFTALPLRAYCCYENFNISSWTSCQKFSN